MSNGGTSPQFKDIIVAVHGIGQQIRYATVRSVATRLAGSKTLCAGAIGPPMVTQPLGYFHSQVKDITSVSLLDDLALLGSTALASTGFSEVYWADIPEKVVKEGRTLEETKAWAQTVVARAQAIWKQEGRPGIIPPDFGLAAEVIEESIETVYVLENLLFLADKAGLFKFDLRQVLEDYLGDVQIVTEFANYREEIVARFHLAMQNIYEQQSKPGKEQVRLHIVAHSEGTVISFLGLLQAMSGQQVVAPATPNASLKIDDTRKIPEWLKHVHGYMTIGSPIDKHLLLWPGIWKTLNPGLANGVLSMGQIKWRNYYDYGDPVGFALDTARCWLDEQESTAFQFCGCSKCNHDMGFARYLLPGKAHNDYWNDPEVFEHFVDDVVSQPATYTANHNPAKRPTDKPIVPWLSPALPYVFSAVLLIVGVYLLNKAVANFTFPDDPLTKHFLFTNLGMEPIPGVSRWDLLRNTLGISALIAGVTLFARFQRLAVGWDKQIEKSSATLFSRFLRWAARWQWTIAGLFAYIIGCLMYIVAVTGPAREQIGAIFSRFSPFSPTFGVLSLGLIVGVLGFLFTGPSRQEDEDRRKRWFWKGMRPLITCGAVGVALIVASILSPNFFDLETQLTAAEKTQFMQLAVKDRETIIAAGFGREEILKLIKTHPNNLGERLKSVKPFLTARPPVWPVLLAAAGFLYLWWLATMLFDLAFVWQRYVRRSVVNQRLSEWAPGRLPRPRSDETCRNLGQTSPEATTTR